MAASTVFAMLYIGAIDGTERFLAPRQVYRMTESQAMRTEARDRVGYAEKSAKAKFTPRGRRWYADNTRESIRDETLRAFVDLGAVTVRKDLPTTSGRPRYALERSFATLFDPAIEGQAFEEAAAAWQRAKLSPGALARVALIARGAVAGGEGVLVRFPSGETRQLAVGPSSEYPGLLGGLLLGL